MEAHLGLQHAGQQRPEEAPDVHGQIEDGKARIAQRMPLWVLIERPHHGTGRGLHPATAQRDAHQTHYQPRNARQQRQRNVPQHHHDARIEQRALGPQHPIGQPAAQDGGQIDTAPIDADNAARQPLVDAQPSPCDLIVEVDEQDALHPVIGKTLPQLDVKERGQRPGMAEESVRDVTWHVPLLARPGGTKGRQRNTPGTGLVVLTGRPARTPGPFSPDAPSAPKG